MKYFLVAFTVLCGAIVAVSYGIRTTTPPVDPNVARCQALLNEFEVAQGAENKAKAEKAADDCIRSISAKP